MTHRCVCHRKNLVVLSFGGKWIEQKTGVALFGNSVLWHFCPAPLLPSEGFQCCPCQTLHRGKTSSMDILAIYTYKDQISSRHPGREEWTLESFKTKSTHCTKSSSATFECSQSRKMREFMTDPTIFDEAQATMHTVNKHQSQPAEELHSPSSR